MAERECASHSFDGEAFSEGKAAEKVSHQRRKQLDTWMHKNRTDEFEYKQKKRDGVLVEIPCMAHDPLLQVKMQKRMPVLEEDLLLLLSLL